MRMRWVTAAAAAMALVPVPAGAQSVKAGIEAWQRADYAAAIKIWRPLADQGDPDAAFNVGQAYRLGRGVPVNLSLAQRWFQAAAEKGHLDAQATLGLLLFDSGDRAQGIKWLQSAADRGEPRALLIYGTALFNGDGVTRDPVLAYALISRAAAQGLAPAKATLAQLDTLIPVDQRKKGVAVALALAKTAQAPAPGKAAAAAKALPPAKPAPKRAKTPVAVTSPARGPAASAAAGGWRVQLGAFARRASAEALFQRLSGTAALSGRHAFLIPVGAMTRLQVGPFDSRSAANAACSALSAKGQVCFAVAGK
jgi:TPR repeat protein